MRIRVNVHGLESKKEADFIIRLNDHSDAFFLAKALYSLFPKDAEHILDRLESDLSHQWFATYGGDESHIYGIDDEYDLTIEEA